MRAYRVLPVNVARSVRHGWRYRANIAARVLAALTGGYAIPALFAFVSARLLPLPRLDAIMPGMLLSFAIMPAMVIWVFLVRSATRAWLGILLVIAMLALVGWACGAPMSWPMSWPMS